MSDEKQQPQSPQSNGTMDGEDKQKQAQQNGNGNDGPKSEDNDKDKEKEKQPEGGYDSTPLHPSKEQTYDIRIIFHSASNLPVADYGSGSADPFILAQIQSSQDNNKRHGEDPYHRFRSKTIRRSIEPCWEAEWVIGGVPSSGFSLSTRIYDEDPDDHDDRLGKVEYESGPISENWKGPSKQTFKVKKKGADVMAYTLRWVCLPFHKGRKLHAHLVMSIEVLGKTKKELEVGKTYTINSYWWKHYAPMIGRIAGVKTKDHQGVERYNFQANQMQLRGPVPNELYHRYVDFKSFVGGMFKATGVRGTVLNKALHHQHERIYNFNKQTEFGAFDFDYSSEGREQSKKKAAEGMTDKFLELTHHDQGGRIFTYVITLDGMFRFTETGKEFGIDLLSKHTMHSDVNIYIAWSGEFLIRRVAYPDKSPGDPNQRTHPSDDIPGGPPNDAPPKDPKSYELIIDNDSGTYRPNADLLPIFKKFLQANFPGLKIMTFNCTDKKLSKIKDEQKKIKGKEGDGMVIGQGSISSGSISSSDQESLNERANNFNDEQDGSGGGKLEKGVEAVENPKDTIKDTLHLSKGKEEREHAEERDDQAS